VKQRFRLRSRYSRERENARSLGTVKTPPFRMDPTVPLVVPEVNPETLASHDGIIANPNCVAIQRQ
jgi:aspartate-semialdehyde dehydrogenase